MIETLSDIFTSSLGVIFKAIMIVILASFFAGFLVVAYKGVKILICKIRNRLQRMKAATKMKLNLYIDKVAEAISSRYEKVIQRNNGIELDGKDRRVKINGLWRSTCGKYYLIISENGFYWTVTLHEIKTAKEESGILRNLYEAREKYLFQFDGKGLYTFGYNPSNDKIYLANLGVSFKREESWKSSAKDEILKSDDVVFEKPSAPNSNSNSPDLGTLRKNTDELYKQAQEVYKDLKESVNKILNGENGTESNDKKNS